MAKANLNKLRRYRKIAASVEKVGADALGRAFKLDRVCYPASSLQAFLETLGLTPGLSDRKYYFIPFEDWKNIIEVDWVNEKEYYSDYWDCDNYGWLFSARMAMLFKVNTAGRGSGTLHNPNTGKFLGNHAFNIIVSRETDGFHAWLYEPMNDLYTEITKNKKLVLKNWEYRLTWNNFF